MGKLQQETELENEIIGQIYSYFNLCAMYEDTASIKGFAQHLIESYE